MDYFDTTYMSVVDKCKRIQYFKLDKTPSITMRYKDCEYIVKRAEVERRIKEAEGTKITYYQLHDIKNKIKRLYETQEQANNQNLDTLATECFDIMGEQLLTFHIKMYLLTGIKIPVFMELDNLDEEPKDEYF